MWCCDWAVEDMTQAVDLLTRCSDRVRCDSDEVLINHVIWIQTPLHNRTSVLRSPEIAGSFPAICYTNLSALTTPNRSFFLRGRRSMLWLDPKALTQKPLDGPRVKFSSDLLCLLPQPHRQYLKASICSLGEAVRFLVFPKRASLDYAYMRVISVLLNDTYSSVCSRWILDHSPLLIYILSMLKFNLMLSYRDALPRLCQISLLTWEKDRSCWTCWRWWAVSPWWVSTLWIQQTTSSVIRR